LLLHVSTRPVYRTALALLVACGATSALADGQGNPKAVSSKDGEYFDADGTPTFKIDGNKVDYYTFMGFIRYGANCLACHGPDGLGSTYAPSLVNAFQHLDYGSFLETVAGGKKNVSASQQLVMPSLGTDKNVMCYIDGIYVYLRARSDGALGRGRPEDHDPKPAAFKEEEDQCMG
jgi:methanol metabolism-related c-type cytochrome